MGTRWTPAAVLAALAAAPAPPAGAAEAGRGPVYGVVELAFRGPAQKPADAPARDVEFAVRFRHEAGAEHTVHGFWDGDGTGGPAGDVFKVRFCPTKPGRWDLAEVRSNSKELAGQRQGDHVTATASKHPGFWEPDPDSPGRRWYKRSDGSHQYVVGNTQYSFLSGMRNDGPVPGFDLAADVAANAGHFKKLRFALTGDRYPHPADKPFLDKDGRPTDAGDESCRPNPGWFAWRADVAVKAAYDRDLIADLILCGPDTEDSRATLRARGNAGDPTPWLRYVAARYGSYPNVWLCLCNEYDIKTPKYPAADVARWGRAARGFLPYPTPVSVHASQYPDGKGEAGRPGAAWSAKLDAVPAWHDHQILQRKIRAIGPAADVVRRTGENPGGKPRERPTVNDELSYQGAGDNHSEADTLSSHVGAFLGGGYGSTGYKPANKVGHYFWGGFTPAEHTAAEGLKFFREMIDKHVTFWKMAPDTSIFPGLDPDFRAMGWPGREYIVGTDKMADGVVADLPPGTWTVRRFNVLLRSETVLSESASGRFTFNALLTRPTLFHFKKNESKPNEGKPAAGPRVVFDVDLTKGAAGPGVVTGGRWDGGWRTTGAKGERVVFDAGRPVANGCLEVRVTTPRKPWGDGAAGKVNWVGLHEDPGLSQNTSAGDLFYARAGNPGYKFSNVKAAGRPFDRTEHEPRVGSADDWVADDTTVMTVKLEWRDGVPVFHDPKGRATVFPRDTVGGDTPVDRLRYVFLGSDLYTGLTVPGLRFLSAKLLDLGPAADGPPPERLKVHDAGHGLVTEAGRPVFLLADTAWGLAQRLRREEATGYLLTRRAQRFNAVAFVLFTPGADDHNQGRPGNAYGAAPFAVADGNPDPTRPLGPYWEHADFAVRECRRLGLYALVLPCWGSAVAGKGNGDPTADVCFTPESAREYGRWLGARYRGEPHVVWVLGGDRSAASKDRDYRPVFRAMAAGLAAGAGPGALMTYHPQKKRPQSADWFHADGWLAFNSVQHWPEDQLPALARDFGLSPPKPTWLFEGRYEGYWKNKYTAEQWGDWQCRQQAYQTAFAGAFGHTYGHERVYGFGKDGADWKAHLDAPGARSMAHLARLMNGLKHGALRDRVPDQSLVDGDEGKAERLRSDRITAFRTPSGSLAAFYTAAGRPVRVRLDKLAAGPMNGWWFDPRTGRWATPAASRSS